MPRGCDARRSARAMPRPHGACWPWPWCSKASRVPKPHRPPAWIARPTLRDWVHGYNEQGLAGLSDRKGKVGPKRMLTPEQEAEVAAWVRRGPDPSKDGVVRWRRADLARAIAAAFGVELAERSISDVLRRLGFRRLVPRPRHPGQDRTAQASFKPSSRPT